MKFAEKLKKAMQELNLNQRQVVTMTGKSKGSVSQYLSGKQIPSEDVQSAIATSLGLASDYFTGMDKELQVMPQLEIRDGVIPRLDVTKAAKLMGMNHNTVRKGLQQGVFPWGYAVHTSDNRWSYFINAKRFAEVGMFQNYAIDNDLNYVYDKIKNYYELGTYKSDEEMDKEDQKVAGDIEKPDASGRRSRTRKAEQKAEPVEKAEKTARTRKSRAEVEAENHEKMTKYQEKVDEAIQEAAGDSEEVDFDVAAEAAASVPAPELQKPPRRTRKERKTAEQTVEQSEPVQEEPEVTESESDKMDATPETEGAMNAPEPPVRGQRRRRTRQ